MIETLSLWFIMSAQVYVGLGLLFAIAFVAFGVAGLDPSARGGSLGFRLCILPGVAALWPLLLVRWARHSAAPDESNAHRDLARRESRS